MGLDQKERIGPWHVLRLTPTPECVHVTWLQPLTACSGSPAAQNGVSPFVTVIKELALQWHLWRGANSKLFSGAVTPVLSKP